MNSEKPTRPTPLPSNQTEPSSSPQDWTPEEEEAFKELERKKQ